MIIATITRPNLGSLAYVRIGETEYVTTTTSEAHGLLLRSGQVKYLGRHGKTERYSITKPEKTT